MKGFIVKCNWKPSNGAEFRVVQSGLFLNCSSAVSSPTAMYIACNPCTGFCSGCRLEASRKIMCFLAHIQRKTALLLKTINSEWKFHTWLNPQWTAFCSQKLPDLTDLCMIYQNELLWLKITWLLSVRAPLDLGLESTTQGRGSSAQRKIWVW